MMSSIRVSKKHVELLDRLIAVLLLRGKKISKKDLIGKIIEDAAASEGIILDEETVPLEKDIAWLCLEESFDFGIPDLSENVDKYLYEDKGAT